MKKLLIISLLATGIFAADTSTDKWKVHGRLDMYLQTINVVGNPQNSREGNTDNEALNLNLTGPLVNGEAGVETRFRHTNDERIQEDNTEILYLRSYFRNKEWGLEAGDVAASYNPYIFSGSLKGVKVAYKSPEKARTWDYSGVLGLKKSSWRDTYNSDSTEEATGYAGAFSVKYRHERAKEISISMAALDTDLSTGGVDNNTTLGKRGYSVGLDGKWRFSKYITLKGRGAVTDEQLANAHYKFPIQTPTNKEEFYYRTIFTEHFPSDTAAWSVPQEASVACSTKIALEWDEAFKNMNDPSGRAVANVHDDAY